MSLYHEASKLWAEGLCPLPFEGKSPNLRSWKPYQAKRPTLDTLHQWDKQGLFKNLGVVLGSVSNNTIALDFDGAAGYPAFASTFPELIDTRTVATGSGVGKHVYYRATALPPTIKAMNTPLGHVELRSEGCCLVTPPSLHPETGNPYTLEKDVPILHLPHLNEVVAWVKSFEPQSTWTPPQIDPHTDTEINPEVITAIANALQGRRTKIFGDWINCSCIYPERHTNGDRHPSFGFNTRTGYGNCYVCGTLLAKDICERLGIDPRDYGGLLKAEPVKVVKVSSQVSHKPTRPPVPPNPSLESITAIRLPKWLAEYVGWSSRIANQTPITFHLGMGLWMGAIAIARRLYIRAYWGQRIFPNLYMMFIAPTTYYRKTTALERGQDIIGASIPHMLMGTPGSPERFQDALAGQKPRNFESLSHANQELINRGNQFSAQRGLLKDEVAGLFGSFKRDYMAGMKDFLLDVYECPDSLIKETQTGQMAVSDVYLSILGVTTPTGLMDSLKSYADWESGLLPRFLLLTPETDYQERPTPEAYIPPPDILPTGLKMLHEALPEPEREDGHWQSPSPLQIDFEHWDAVKDYGDELRRLTDPSIDNGIDARLRGTYGRMHVQAIKMAQICAAFDWVDGGAKGPPSVTRENWETSKAIAEHFRMSAHRLLDELEEGHTARQERSNQDRVLDICKGQLTGVKLRDIYRTLGLTSAETRQSAQELCRAGLLEEIKIGRAEGYRYVTD